MIINIKEYINKSFTYEIDLPSKIVEILTYGDDGKNTLCQLKYAINLIQKVKYKNSFSLNVSFYAYYSVKEDSFEIRSINTLILKGKLRTKEYNLLIEIAKHNVINQNELEEIKTFSFTPIDNCSNCSIIIEKDDYQYQCYWCKLAFCIKCVENKIEINTGRECYLHKTHNLLYFKSKNKEDLEELDEYKLGKNEFTNVSDSSLRYYHSASCNGCYRGFSETKNNQRYICITCLPGCQSSGGFTDFCYQCIVNMRNRKDGFEPHNGNNHQDEKHVQLMIIHQVSDYYNY